MAALVLGATAPGQALGVRRRLRLQRACFASGRRLAPQQATAGLSGAGQQPELEVKSEAWLWRGHRVSYERVSGGVSGDDRRPPLCVVHGFGSSARHFRSLTTALAAQGYTVYAPDLLGFGASAKPATAYSPTLWAQQVAAFLEEVVGEDPCCLIGNSIGSQVAVIVASTAPKHVAGLALLNCAAGMNQRNLYGDDPTLAALAPVFWLVEVLLKTKPIARFLFNAFRSKANVRQILEQQVYKRPQRVTDELVDTLYEPSEDDGALGVFVEVFTGDPGPRPEPLAQALSVPIKVIWGALDSWTPADGTVARACRQLAATKPQQVEFDTIANCGHVPYDDAPEDVAALLLPWLARLKR